MVPVVLTPRPFAEPEYLTQPAGRTLRAALVDAVAAGAIEVKDLARAELHVDGVMIPRERALDHILREGEVVNVVVYPHGGGGGGGKDIGQVLLQVAVIAVSAWIGGGGVAALGSGLFAKVAAAAVMVGGNMALNAMYAPKQTAEKANDRYALQSASNTYRQWGSMPLILGECVIAPDLAVKTFTRAIGDDVWIYGILAHHYGPCHIDELKIGDTLVSSMGAGDAKFVHHLTPGARTFSLVPNDIDQVDLAPEELTATVNTATPVVRATESEGEQFEIDLYLPGGLYFQKDDGRKIAAAVTVTVRYRQVDAFGDPVGSGAWSHGLTIPLKGSSKDPMRVTRSLSLPMGRYEFELKRSVLEDTNEKRHTDVAWSAIRAITFRKPVTDEVLSISEFAVRATALNQGNLAPITCRVIPLCETWTGTEWGPPVPTSNPAALTRWLLTGPAPAKPLLPAQADQGLRVWSALCDEYDWKAHIPVMEDRSQAETLALLEKAGRASIFWDGTQSVASCWVEKPVPKQMFTGVNLKDHRFEIAYADPVHAFRVEFQNLEQGGEADEVMVYNDGYAEFADPDAEGGPVLAATLIEALRLEDGQKTPERAFRDARWEMGRRKHQRRFDSWSADIEAVVCRYGDRVRLAWLRAGGEGGARVRSRRWSDGPGSLVTGLRLDREVEMEAGVDYVVDLRLIDQLLSGVPVVNPAAAGKVTTREIEFAAPRPEALCPRRADLIAFGPAEQVTEDVEIIGLEPGEGLTANLTGVRYVAPLLMAGETGPIPELPNRLSRDRSKTPPMPSLLGVEIDESGARIGFSMPPWRGSPITGFSCRWRAAPAEGETSPWADLPDLPAGSMILSTPPLRNLPGEDEITRVQIDIRAMTASGLSSQPLIVTAVMPVVGAPQQAVWDVAIRPADLNGTQQPGLIVTGVYVPERVASVSISHGLSAEGPWREVYNGPPTPKGVPIDNLSPNVEHWVSIVHYSAQGVPSGHLVLGPHVAPGLVAGGVTHLGAEPVDVVLGRLATAEGLSAANAAAVIDLEEVFGDTVSAAESALVAGQAAQLAQLKAGEAGDAATASNVSAGIAGTKATEAGNSATAANASQLAASVSAGGAKGNASLLLPDRFNAAADFFYRGTASAHYAGAPETHGDPSVNGGLNIVADATYGYVARAPAAGWNVLTQGVVAAGAGRIYETTAVWNVSTAPTAAAQIRLYMMGLNGAYGYIPGTSAAQAVPVGTTGLVTQTRRWAETAPPGGSAWPAGSSWLRPMVQLNTMGGGVFDLVSFSTRDVTSQAASEVAASASVTSAGQAAAYANDAGEFASASEGAATQAATRAGEALTYRNQASTARDDAVTASVAAGTSATTAKTEAWKAFPPASDATASQFSHDLTGAPAAMAGIPVADVIADANAPGGFGVRPGGAGFVAHRQAVPKLAGRVYEFRAKFIRDTGSSTGEFYIRLRDLDAAFNATGWGSFGSGPLTPSAAVQEAVMRVSDVADASQGIVAWSGVGVLLRPVVVTTNGRLLSFSAEDITSEIRSAAHAATSLSHASQAGAEAARAELNANLAVSLGTGGGVMKDPTFNNWPVGSARPTNVGAPVGNLAVSRQTVDLIYGDKALRLNDTSGGNAYLQVEPAGFAPASDATHWVVEYQLTLNSGDLKRVGVQFRANRAVGYYGATVDLAANHPNPVVGATYRGSQLFEVTATGGAAGAPTNCVAYFYTNLSSFSGGAYSAKNVTLHLLQFRPATPEEIAANEAIPGLEAAVAVNAGAVAAVQDQLQQAFFEIIAAAGGDPAQLAIKAGPTGSTIALAATALVLRNIVNGTSVKALELVNGRAVFGAPVSSIKGTRRTTLGSGFGANGDLTLWAGPTSIAYGAETVDNGILGITEDDGFFGGKTYSGPFDSGPPSATEIALTKNAWTTIAEVPSKMMLAEGLSAGVVTYSLFVSGAAADPENPQYAYQYRVVAVDQDGSNPVTLFGSFGSATPNVWITPGAAQWVAVPLSTTRGNKRIRLQINPTGSDIALPRARNGRVRGLYAA